MTWISTMSGKRIDFLEPDPEQIDVEDIAAGLAALPRWLGQTQQRGAAVHYSVAQHSVLCSKMCPTHALHALLHDAAEAYMGDCPRPLKSMLGMEWFYIEQRLLWAIFDRFGLEGAIPPAVKAIDDRLLMTERRDLQPFCPPWGSNPDGGGAWPDPFTWRITPWPRRQAHDAFLAQFNKLMATEGKAA